MNTSPGHLDQCQYGGKLKLAQRAVLSFLMVLFLFTGEIMAQGPRTSYTINSNWDFFQGALELPVDPESISWEAVSLPHTWNSEDVYDDEPGYYRGEGWYYKKFSLNPDQEGKKVFLQFKGANQETDVYVNGNHVGQHLGGYSAFNMAITDHIRFGEENELLVRVNNRFNEDIPTLTADFTFFGGIYRDIYLTSTNEVHFSMNNYGSSGVQVSTPNVSARKADVEVKGDLVNESSKTRRIEVASIIKDAEHKAVATVTSSHRLKAGESITFNNEIKGLEAPHLWSIEDPYLYRVVTQVRDAKGGEILDEITSPLGFRWFRFDATEGFFLNGKAVKLIGVNRHQDYAGLGNALPKSLHVRDVKLAKEMGANFLRIAHYPQDRSVLDACDRLGIITSVEIPIVNTITESEAFADNSEEMLKEMILQDYNHPSVVIWAYMNEVLLRLKFKEQPERQKEYFKNVAELAQRLENTARSMDPYRYTMIPNHGSFDLYKEVGLTDIPMIVGWNLYQGWYGRNLDGFAKFLDRHHKELPDKPLIVTEYGAGSDPRLRTDTPERFDYSLEYQTIYHQVYMKAILERPFVAGVNVWNLADFSSEGRIDAVPNINNKGLLTYDRIPKDAYYLYQAYLLEEPFVAIGSKLWSHRAGVETAPGINEQEIIAFTNQKNATLYHNGESLGEKEASESTISWIVPFTQGINLLELVSETENGTIKDFHKVDFNLLPENLKDAEFDNLLVNLGDKRYFFDDLTREVWLPAQEYKEGQWGVIGGKDYTMNPAQRQSYGTDQSIVGSDNDPLYQTQSVGLKAFKADVPDGEYEITLHFAELVSDEFREALAYNLDDGTEAIVGTKDRVYDVLVNGRLVLQNLNLANDHGREQAVSYTIAATASRGKGLEIEFRAIKGETVLNALEIKRLF